MEDQMSALRVIRLLKVSHRTRNICNWAIDERLLLTAEPFAWSAEVVDAVLSASRSIPLDTPLNKWNLQTDAAWWRFDKELPFQTVDNASLGVRAIAFGWLKLQHRPLMPAELGMPVCCWIDETEQLGHIHSPVAPSQTFEWEEGTTLGTMLERSRAYHVMRYGPGGPDENAPSIGLEKFMEATEGVARFILAALAWLSQKVPVLEVLPGQIERHRRKAYAKAIKPIDGVRIVQLRKYDTQHVDGEPRKVDWSCRWTVDGHWRQQPCGPKHSDRKLTYIMPFVKGPQDKPLRQSQQKVFVVNR